MRVVKISVKDKEGQYEGTATVRGYSVTDSAPTHGELTHTLIEHLIEEGEISPGNYTIEEAPAK